MGKGQWMVLGASIKNTIDNIIAFHTDDVINCADHVMQHLPLSDIIMTTYKQDEVNKFAEKIPRELYIKWKNFGISQVHEIVLTPTPGNHVQWKKRSSDDAYVNAEFSIKKGAKVIQAQQDKMEAANHEISDKEEIRNDDGGHSGSIGNSVTFKPGDYVKVIAGSFKGLYAVVLGTSYGDEIEINYCEQFKKWWSVKDNDMDSREKHELCIVNPVFDNRYHIISFDM